MKVIRKRLWYVIVLLHVLVVLCALTIGSYEAWDAAIAALGIAASILAVGMGWFMWKVDHALAKCVLVETVADLFAAACTTVFAIFTYYGWDMEPPLQIALRLMILTSATTAQCHLYLTINEIIKRES